jgi:hypothetical protein
MHSLTTKYSLSASLPTPSGGGAGVFSDGSLQPILRAIQKRQTVSTRWQPHFGRSPLGSTVNSPVQQQI